MGTSKEYVSLSIQWSFLNLAGLYFTQANVLVDDNGRGCIGDFGLSKIKYDAQSTAMQDNRKVGTMRFMSPEAMEGKITKEGDVYSFGMLIYQVR